MANVAAGLLLVLFRPYKIGDYVEVAGEEGVVEDLNIFTTTLITLDNIKVILSNSEVRIDAGYEFIEVAGMKGYHGAATVSKLPMTRLPTSFCPLDHARHVSTKVIAGDEDFEFHNFYIPAGGDTADPVVNDKFKHKLDFIENMRLYFTERFAKGDDQQILVGDFNIAPHENDVWSHKPCRVWDAKPSDHVPMTQVIDLSVK